MPLARQFRFVPAILIGLGLVYLLTHDFSEGGGGIRPPASRKPLDFTYPSLQGANWSLAAQRGNVVLVNFWATWCGPCRAETPDLVRLARDYEPMGVAVVGVSLDEHGTGPVREFVNSFRIPYPVLMPPADSPLTSAIQSVPTTLLVDRQGRVAKKYVGAFRGSTFRRDIDTLLRE